MFLLILNKPGVKEFKLIDKKTLEQAQQVIENINIVSSLYEDEVMELKLVDSKETSKSLGYDIYINGNLVGFANIIKDPLDILKQ